MVRGRSYDDERSEKVINIVYALVDLAVLSKIISVFF